jgi:uncharacterized repeat protein (TIGR01451 family)
MKNYMKKIIIVAFAFVLLFTGQSVFAASVFNGQSGDCNPAMGIGIYGSIQQDENNCWTATSVTADPGDIVNVVMYYHNNTSNTLHNVRGVITKTQVNSTTFKFTGKMYSTEGGSTPQTIGTVTLHLSSSQSLTYSSTHWFNSEDAIDNNDETQTFHSDGGQMNIGSVSTGWENQGEFLAVYKVGTTISAACNISNFSASPSTISDGESSTLSWTTSHCSSVSISGIGSMSGVSSGSYSVSPSATKQYTLTANGSGGNSDTATTTVTVEDEDNNNDENIPEADTKVASSIDSDSARLKGFVDMNDFDNGTVFFVYGQDENQIEDVQDDYSTYNEVDEDGNDLQKEKVDTNLDDSETYTFDATGLEEDADYFYTICVQYENNDGDDELVCGDVEDFSTDDNGNSNNNDDACEISQFSTNRTTVGDGNSATLTWDTDNCDSVYISGIGNVNASGSRAVYPSDTTTYTLSAYDSNGNTDTAHVTISVTGGVYQGACGITSTASGVTKTSATLNGITVGPNSSSTYFEYGLTSALGQRTSARNVSGGTSFSETLYGLIPGNTYYFRLVSNCESGNKFGSTSTLRTASDTVPAYVAPVVHTTTTTVTSSGSPIMLKIENRFEFVSKGDVVNYTVTYKNIGKNTLRNSLIQVMVPEGIEMLNASHGSYSNTEHVLNVPLGDLVKNAEGEIYLDAKINSISTDKLVSTATLVYTNPSGAQENAIAYVINIPKDGKSSLGAASLFAGIMSLNLLGWLLLILIVLIIILLTKKYFSKKDNKYTPSY